MAFMIHHTSGLICAPLSSALTRSLQLPQMVPESEATEVEGTAYTVSVDGAGTTTGISAHDRALTCRNLAQPESVVVDFRRPGHVFPLRARDGGVRERRGHTEATVEFCRLAGKRPVGVLCELVAGGTEVQGRTERKAAGMLRRDGCLEFGRRWGIKVCTIDMVVEFLERERIGG
ncbi:3,4-dihydroxy-2-butanone 4-phosphate synthase [Usnea florida]